MLVASQKRKENIAEYLLYMWQVEDIVRAFNLDIERIRQKTHVKYKICILWNPMFKAKGHHIHHKAVVRMIAHKNPVQLCL